MSTLSPKRLPLRIPGGWTVRHNELRELDLDAMGEDHSDWLLMTQDLALFKRADGELLVDVGWSPEESPRGQYVVKVVLDEDWQRPIARYATRKVDELIAALEAWFESQPEIPTPRLIERLGDVRPEVRARAAGELVRRNAFDAIDPIVEAMKRERDQKTLDRLEEAMRALIYERKRQPSPP